MAKTVPVLSNLAMGLADPGAALVRQSTREQLPDVASWPQRPLSARGRHHPGASPEWPDHAATPRSLLLSQSKVDDERRIQSMAPRILVAEGKWEVHIVRDSDRTAERKAPSLQALRPPLPEKGQSLTQGGIMGGLEPKFGQEARKSGAGPRSQMQRRVVEAKHPDSNSDEEDADQKPGERRIVEGNTAFQQARPAVSQAANFHEPALERAVVAALRGAELPTESASKNAAAPDVSSW